MSLHSQGPEDTFEWGCRLGHALGAEDLVLGLVGPLGSGKTLFVKGLAQGLGLDASLLASPTFVIANEYALPNQRRLVHVDCYRLSHFDEIASAGWLDWLPPKSVLAVEWPDRIEGLLGDDHLELRFERDREGGSQRELNAIASGAGAETVLARWRAALG